MKPRLLPALALAAAAAAMAAPEADAASLFSGFSSFAAGRNPISVAIGDLNGDGKADLVVANFSCCSLEVSVLLGNGDGTFGATTDFPTGPYPSFVAIG